MQDYKTTRRREGDLLKSQTQAEARVIKLFQTSFEVKERNKEWQELQVLIYQKIKG